MITLINKTNHAVIFDGVVLVPMIPQKVDAKISDIKEKFPHIAKMLDDKAIQSLTKAAAEEAQAEIDEKMKADAGAPDAESGK